MSLQRFETLLRSEVAAAIQVKIPGFQIRYRVDPARQAIADSWPRTIDDSAAREEWGWAHRYDLPTMTEEMLIHLAVQLKND